MKTAQNKEKEQKDPLDELMKIEQLRRLMAKWPVFDKRWASRDKQRTFEFWTWWFQTSDNS